MRFFLFVCMIFSLSLVGCGTNLKDIFYENISEIQRDVFVGKFNQISATLLMGDREKEYLKNGYSTENIDFSVLMIEGMETTKNIEYSYRLFVDDMVYEGVFKFNPFGGLIVDMGNIVAGDIMVVTVVGDETIDIVLRSITDGLSTSCDDAINIVMDNFGGRIRKLKKGRTFVAESYIKLMGMLEINSEDLCWCVTIITRAGERFSYVVSARTGDVLSVQNNMA